MNIAIKIHMLISGVIAALLLWWQALQIGIDPLHSTTSTGTSVFVFWIIFALGILVTSAFGGGTLALLFKWTE